MPNFWNQYGQNYDEVNQNTGGVADFVNKTSQNIQQPDNSPDDSSSLGNRILAGMSGFNRSFVNSSPGAQLGSSIANKIAPMDLQSPDIIQREQANPAAASIGKGLGMIAGGLTPGGGVAKFFPGLIQDAITASPYAITSAINTLKQTGDPIAAVKRGLEQEALGVGAGTAIHGIGLFFSKAAQLLHPQLGEVNAASYGVNARDISGPDIAYAKKMGINPKSYQANQGDAQLQKVMDVLQTEGGRGKKGLEKAVDWFNGQYDAVNQFFKASGAQLTNKIQDALASPVGQTLVGKFGTSDVTKVMTDLAGVADNRIASGTRGWSDAINYLNEMNKLGVTTGKGMAGGGAGAENAGETISNIIAGVSKKHEAGELLQDSSHLLKAHLYDLTGNVLDEAKSMGADVPDIQTITKLFGAFPSLQSAIARRAGRPMGSLSGSETTAGTGLMAAGGGLLGGDPLTAGLKVLGATAAAPLIKKGMVAASNQLMGRSAAWMDALGKYGPPGMYNQATKSLGAAMTGITSDQGQGGQMPPQTQPIPTTQQPSAVPAVNVGLNTPAPVNSDQISGGMPVSSNAAAMLQKLAGQETIQSTPPPPQKVNPEHVDEVKTINDKEAQLDPQQVQTARAIALAPFKDMIKQKIQEKWDAIQGPKPDFQTFYNDSESMSNHFKADDPTTAKIIAGSDYKNYLKSYHVALNLQSLGPDLMEAMSYIPGKPGVIKGIVSGIGSWATGGPEAQAKHDELVRTMYTAMTGEMKDPPKEAKESIEDTLTNMRREALWGKSPSKLTSQLFELLQNQYGIRFDLLKQYGLPQGGTQ